MAQPTETFVLAKKPIALLPMVLSALALAVVAGRLLFVGTAREVDEGTAAHLFQLFMTMQVPVVVAFLLKYHARFPQAALRVLAGQTACALVAMAPVFYFNL
jgi:hypothetical protein